VEAGPAPSAEPPLTKRELGPACPPSAAGDVSLANAEADIEKQRSGFARCARAGRGGVTEVSWTVPPHGAVQMLEPLEPEPDEWCLIQAAKRVTFRERAPKTVLVNLTVRLDPDGSVKLEIAQAQLGNAVVCEVVAHGGIAEGSDRKLLTLADSMTVCYRRAQRSDPSQTGNMQLSLTLRDDGTVSDVRIDAKRRTDLARDCVRATAALASFPAPSGPARLDFALRYVPE
jgi:hypothetical protein